MTTNTEQEILDLMTQIDRAIDTALAHIALRDSFAREVLAGGYAAAAVASGGSHVFSVRDWKTELAAEAYDIADTMMSARLN